MVHADRISQHAARPKLTVAATFGVEPVRGGGQARVRGLYGALAAAGVVVDVVTPGAFGTRPVTRELAPGLREIRVPVTRAHRDAGLALQETNPGVPVSDVAFALEHRRSPEYARAVARSARDATAVVACHPYVTEVLLEQAPDRPLIYEAQDVETDLKAGMLGAGPLADVVRRCEAATCAAATQVLVCSTGDGGRLQSLFAVSPDRVATVPNGYDPHETPYTPAARRTALRRALGIDGRSAVFVGSWHLPNVDAARVVVAAAARRPSLHVLVLGSVADAIGEDPVTANVDLVGSVDDGFLEAALAVADVAVNPVVTGSGTNLKMLRYAGAGVPIVSTAFGARGLGLEAIEHYAPTGATDLVPALDGVAAEDPQEVARRCARAHDHVRRTCSWRAIAERWLARDDVRETLRCA